jgi:phenylalanyl-tRNA synthetase alpha subunit
MDELDFMLKRYSMSFEEDMELATKFGDLYAKVQTGVASQKMNLENLEIEIPTKSLLESLENPSRAVLDSLFDKFIQKKRSNYQSYTIVEDIHIKKILEYGYLEVNIPEKV